MIEKQFGEVTTLKETILNVQTKIEKMETKNSHETILKNLEAIVKAVVKTTPEKAEKAEGDDEENEEEVDE